MRRQTRRAKRSAPVRDAWVVRRRRFILAALLLAALSSRVVAFLQVRSTPLVQMDRWRQTDMNYYVEWARRIEAGDWRSASLPLPMHRWHHDVAARYWAGHPDEKASFAQTGRDPDEALWARWMRVPRFYQDPLYAYLIAAADRAGGDAIDAMLTVQLAAGILTIFLIWSLTRAFFGDAVAAVAGAVAVLSAPLLFYELLVLRDPLIAGAGVLILWLFEQARRRGSGWSALLGVAIGAACVLKSTFILLGVALGGWMVYRALHGRDRAMALRAAGCLAGCALAIAPVMARNVAVHVPALSLASSGPLTFVSANARGATPDVGFGIDAQSLAAFLGSTDGGWGAALQAALAARGPLDYLALVWRKWDRAWHWFEIPNNENFYYARQHVPMLAVLPVTFAIVGPLAAIGLVLALRRRREVWPLFVLVAVTLTPLLVFYVLGRFRVAFMAALIPFAAYAAVAIGQAARARNHATLAGLVAAVAVVALWIDRPLARDQVLIRTSDWILPWSVEYEGRVYGALDEKDPRRAADAYLEFFRHQPTDAQITASGDPHLPAELADMHAECAQILKAAGRAREAEEQLVAARRLLALTVTR